MDMRHTEIGKPNLMQKLAQRLDIKDFRLILAIRQTGQLALAAERLSMTQPAASRMLASVERTVGRPLFERHPRGMTATAVGDILARHALNLLNGLDQAFEEVEAVGSGSGGAARIGAVTGGAVAFVVPAIHALKRDAEGADIHVEVAPSDALIAGLLKGDYDFVLSRIPPGTDARQFTIQPGRTEVVRFLVRESHPLTSSRRLGLDRLRDYEWVIQASGTPMRQAIEEAFGIRGIALPREIVNTTSLLVVIAYLASTDAIAPLSKEVAELLGPAGFSGRLVALDMRDQLVISPYHLVTRRNQMMGPLAARLRDLVFHGLRAPD